MQTNTTTTLTSLSSSGNATKTGRADGEHPDDPEHEDGTWMRSEGNRRKKTDTYLRTSEVADAKKESEECRRSWGWLHSVNEEDDAWRTEEEAQFEKCGPGAGQKGTWSRR